MSPKAYKKKQQDKAIRYGIPCKRRLTDGQLREQALADNTGKDTTNRKAGK